MSCEEAAVPFGLQPEVQVEVDHREGTAFRQCGQAQDGVGVDVLLAEFDEPATGREDLHATPNRLSGKRIEYDVHAVAVGDVEDFVGKVDASRVADVLDAQTRQQFAFGVRAGRRIDTGADHLGDGHRGQSDTAGRGMDQHSLAAGQPPDLAQRMPRGEIRDAERGRLEIR